nr:MAG TPA: hypothetical protein [Caudoviricetes sp.]
MTSSHHPLRRSRCVSGRRWLWRLPALPLPAGYAPRIQL